MSEMDEIERSREIDDIARRNNPNRDKPMT